MSVVSLHFLCTLNITLFAVIETGFSVNGFIAVQRNTRITVLIIYVFENKLKKTPLSNNRAPVAWSVQKENEKEREKKKKVDN